MAEGPGVDDDGGGAATRLVHRLHQGALVVGLHVLEGQAVLGRDHRGPEHVVGRASRPYISGWRWPSRLRFGPESSTTTAPAAARAPRPVAGQSCQRPNPEAR